MPEVDGYQIRERTPTPDEYRDLCEAVGWGTMMNFAVAVEALSHSTFAVVAVSEKESVGMGRIVGDGAIFFYVQDIAVLPQWQGHGVGKAILSALVGWVRENAPEKSFLGVFAVEGTEAFYERFGFAIHSGDTGMFQVIPPR